MSNITELDIAYLAGFFDGEGSIIICRDKSRLGYPNYRLRITANQVDPTPIYLLKEVFGGLIQFHKVSNPKHRPTYTWQQHSKKAVEALEKLMPYLIVKKEQASFAIAWAAQNKKFQGRKKTIEDIQWCELSKDTLSEMKGYL